MIAAVAVVHRLTVVTRNVRDFQRVGAATLDPFAPHDPVPDEVVGLLGLRSGLTE